MNLSSIVPVVTLIVGGVMLANAIANPKGTKAIFDGVGNLWKVSVNGLLAVPSK
jgi:hypothetical protein